MIIATSGTIPDVHLQLTNNVPVGNYTLATYNTTGSSGTFAATPITNTWTLLTSGTITVSPFTLTDLTATSFPQRFYLSSTP